MADDRSEFIKFIEESSKDMGPFRPSVFYDTYGDTLEIHLRPDSCFSSPLGGGIDVYLSQKDESVIVGLTLWGVKQLLRDGTMSADRLVDGTVIETSDAQIQAAQKAAFDARKMPGVEIKVRKP